MALRRALKTDDVSMACRGKFFHDTSGSHRERPGHRQVKGAFDEKFLSTSVSLLSLPPQFLIRWNCTRRYPANDLCNQCTCRPTVFFWRPRSLKFLLTKILCSYVTYATQAFTFSLSYVWQFLIFYPFTVKCVFISTDAVDSVRLPKMPKTPFEQCWTSWQRKPTSWWVVSESL